MARLHQVALEGLHFRVLVASSKLGGPAVEEGVTFFRYLDGEIAAT